MSHCLLLYRVDESELNALISYPDESLDLVFMGAIEEMVDYVDLDRSWHAIHFVLTGSMDGGAEPLCYLNHGGAALTDGPDPHRALTPQQTQAFHEALDPIDDGEFAQRFDMEKLHEAGVCPNDWDDADPDASLVSVLTYYIFLREFVKAAATDGCGLIIRVE